MPLERDLEPIEEKVEPFEASEYITPTDPSMNTGLHQQSQVLPSMNTIYGFN